MVIKVAIRIRPLLLEELDAERSVHCVQYCADGRSVIVAEEKQFELDKCFSEHQNQENVFLEFISPLVEKFIAGENCCVLAYGQTGSGKSYTMGSDHPEKLNTTDESAGIIPRLLENLFTVIKKEPDPITLRMSFVEIFNDSVYDIMHPVRSSLQVQDFGNSVRMLNLSEFDVTNFDDAVLLFAKAVKARTHAFTDLNANSSRSHAFFIIKMRRETENSILESKLQLVDLAGSENPRRANTKGERFAEGVNINKSLLFLGEVITALCAKSSYVNYRNHILTRILKETLNGSSTTRMIACINPHINSIYETVDTLRYASSARRIPSRTIAKPGKENKLVPPTPLKDFSNPMTPSVSSQAVNLSLKPRYQSLGPLSSTGARPPPPPKFNIAIGGDEFLSPLSEKIRVFVDKRISQTLDRKSIQPTSKRPVFEEESDEDFFTTPCKRREEAMVDTDTAIERIISPIANKLSQRMEESIQQRFQELQQIWKKCEPEKPKHRCTLADVTNLSLNIDVDCINKTPVKIPKLSEYELKKGSKKRSAEQVTDSVKKRRTTMCSKGTEKPTYTIMTRRRSTMCLSVEESTCITKDKRQSKMCLSILEERPQATQHSKQKRKQRPDSSEEFDIFDGPNNLSKKPAGSKKLKKNLTSTTNDLDLRRKTLTDKILNILNKGSMRDLQALPAIGPKSAYMIHTYRNMFGNYECLEDLKKVGLTTGFYSTFAKRNFLL